MARSEARKAALRFCLATVGALACVFGWVSVLSFDVADLPTTSVWPPRDPPGNLCGVVGATVAHTLFFYLGVGTYALMGLVTLAVLSWSRGVLLGDLWLRLIGAVMVVAVVCGWAAMLMPASERWLVVGPGGVLGQATARFFVDRLQSGGTHLVFVCALVVGMLLAADEIVMRLWRWLHWTGRQSVPALVRGGGAVANGAAAVASDLAGVITRRGNGATPRRTEGTAPRAQAAQPSQRQLLFGRLSPQDGHDSDSGRSGDPAPPEPKAPARVLPVREIRARSSGGTGRIEPKPPSASSYRLPPADLLEPAPPVDREALELACREKAYLLEQTLNEFRLEVEVVAIETGPVITVFELRLAPGIKVSQITSLANDMARALRAPAVRVVAPLPGKNTIGIEVPNIDKEKVRLRDVMESFGRRAEAYALPLFLGKDAAGQPLVADLARMPHLLLAGTTGSGKSVCVSAIIMSLLMTRTPDEVQLILIDPKVVELAAYKDIPHLMCPVVTEIPRAEAILDWAATKMDERYALLAEAGVKDIRAYNRLGREGLRQRLDVASEEELERIPVYLPHIVIVIDELADLMMTSAKEVEFYLCRLAQKSRAVGIHLIVSTQRPQANVVTGLIKSNMPCRICFRVASRLDSRIVLDQNGGEVLMGQGDMLFLPPGSSKLIRAQGTFVSDEELRAVVRHCAQQRPQNFHPELVRLPAAEAGAEGERDELFDQAVDIILEAGRGSVSLLQRRLMIGYGRAARLIDQMYAAGIVGEYKGSQAREVIMTREQWEQVRRQQQRQAARENRTGPT
jgi:S-DNA-T family DNA segregation ATPase FtsK/SpoIIIE